MEKPVVVVETVIDATAPKVWRAMVDKQTALFPGTTIDTDWGVGSRYTLKGEWKGKPYTDYGEIVANDEARELSLTHWSGGPDRPDDYHLVRYRLSPDTQGTRVTLEQFNFGPNAEIDDATRDEFRKNWTMMLGNLKATVEKGA